MIRYEMKSFRLDGILCYANQDSAKGVEQDVKTLSVMEKSSNKKICFPESNEDIQCILLSDCKTKKKLHVGAKDDVDNINKLRRQGIDDWKEYVNNLGKKKITSGENEDVHETKVYIKIYLKFRIDASMTSVNSLHIRCISSVPWIDFE